MNHNLGFDIEINGLFEILVVEITNGSIPCAKDKTSQKSKFQWKHTLQYIEVQNIKFSNF